MFYECFNPKCPQFKGEENKHRKWPTNYGLIYITYKFEDIERSSSEYDSEEELKYPYMLRYHIRLYKQRC